MRNSRAAILVVATVFAFSAGAAQAQTKITVGKIVGGIGLHIPSYIAMDKGFFKEEGLDARWIELQGRPMITAGLTGNLDFVPIPSGGANAVLTANAPLRYIVNQSLKPQYIIVAKPEIKTVEDLRGKTIAISTPFSHPDVIARTQLARHNIDPAQVKLANMGGDADRYRALVARVVDATVVSSEYVPIAAKNGIHQLVSAREIVPDYMRLCMFSSGRTLAARREDAVRFLAAEMSALRYALGHRDEAIKLTQELINVKPDDPRPAYIFDDAVRTGGVDPDISIPMDKVAWMRELLVKDGRLTKPFDLATMMAPEIRAEALGRVGK
jgi:NitT/TauT family transport system substrate-binding protein